MEKQLTRRSHYLRSDSVRGLIWSQPLGYVDSDNWFYYFPARVQPKELDLIIDDKCYFIRRVFSERDGATIAYYRVIADINVRQDGVV